MSASSTSDRTLTSEQIAARLHVNVSMIPQMVADGRLPKPISGSTPHYWSIAEVERVFASMPTLTPDLLTSVAAARLA